MVVGSVRAGGRTSEGTKDGSYNLNALHLGKAVRS